MRFSLPFDKLRTNGSMVLSFFVGYVSPDRAKHNLHEEFRICSLRTS